MATGWASVAPYSEGWGSDGLLLVKFNADGTISWTKKFDNVIGWNVGDYGSRILATSDGIYVAGVTGIGRTWVNNPVILGKFTTAGAVSWVKTYWAVTTSNATDLISSRDGNLLLSSGQYSDILKLDPSGAPIWGRNAVNNAASSLHLIPGEGFVSVGSVYDVGFWLSHSTITTYDDDGNSCANYYNPGTFEATASDETEFLDSNVPVVASTTIPSAGYELQVSDGPDELSTYKACRMSEKGDSDCVNRQIFLTPTDEYEDMVSGGTPTPGGYAERRWKLHFEGAVSDIVVSFVDDDGNPSSGQVDTISGQYPMPEEVYPLYSAYPTGYATYVLGVGTSTASLINDPDGGIPDTQSPGVFYLWGEGFDGSRPVYLSVIQPNGEVIVLDWDPDTGSTAIIKDTSGEYTAACSEPPIYDHVLYFPHIRSDGQWESEVCIINTASTDNASGALTGYDAAGNPVSNLGFSLPPGGRQEFTVGNAFSEADRIRYMTFECDSEMVKGYLKLYVSGKYRVAIPAVDKVNTGNIYVSHIASSSTWTTEIALLNTTNLPITLSIEFSDGTIKPVTLAGKEQKFVSVAELFGGVSQPGVDSAVITNAAGIVGLELFSADAQNLLSGILLQDSLTTHMYYPHTASENGWATGVVAYNPSDSLCYIIFTPYDADGNLLDPFAPSIPVESKTQYVGLIRNLDLPSGTAWVVVASTTPITGFELFTRPNAMAGYTGVNISGKTGIFPKIEKASGAGTGIAFVNLENADATVTLAAMNDAGSVVAAQTLLLTKFQKRVEMVQDLFDSDISEATYVAYECDRLVVGFQLNVSGIMLDGLPGL
jgi:hypothetical protein